jgi:hypothetical protein
MAGGAPGKEDCEVKTRAGTFVGKKTDENVIAFKGRVEPSLKFDVQLISFPSSVYAQVEPWDSEEERTANRLNAYVDKFNNMK